ncbi:uncharacterized [Tachysurus ichikawai]
MALDWSAADYELDISYFATSGFKEPLHISSLPLFIRHSRHRSPPPGEKQHSEPIHTECTAVSVSEHQQHKEKGVRITVENLHTYTAQQGRHKMVCC